MPVNITLEEIIKRKIKYCANDINEELQAVNKGNIRGYEELLKDITLSEEEFITKYTAKITELAKLFQEFCAGETISDDVDELSGYNNAFVDVLSLLDPNLMYDVF